MPLTREEIAASNAKATATHLQTKAITGGVAVAAGDTKTAAGRSALAASMVSSPAAPASIGGVGSNAFSQAVAANYAKNAERGLKQDATGNWVTDPNATYTAYDSRAAHAGQTPLQKSQGADDAMYAAARQQGPRNYAAGSAEWGPGGPGNPNMVTSPFPKAPAGQHIREIPGHGWIMSPDIMAHPAVQAAVQQAHQALTGTPYESLSAARIEQALSAPEFGPRFVNQTAQTPIPTAPLPFMGGIRGTLANQAMQMQPPLQMVNPWQAPNQFPAKPVQPGPVPFGPFKVPTPMSRRVTNALRGSPYAGGTQNVSLEATSSPVSGSNPPNEIGPAWGKVGYQLTPPANPVSLPPSVAPAGLTGTPNAIYSFPEYSRVPPPVYNQPFPPAGYKPPSLPKGSGRPKISGAEKLRQIAQAKKRKKDSGGE